MTSQPLPRSPLFVRLHGRAVHVVDNPTTASYQRDAIGDPALDPYLRAIEASPDRPLGQGPVDPAAWLLGVVKTRCGRDIARNVGGLSASGGFVGTFDDIDLCTGCWRSVAPEERHRLFEHDQSDDTDPARLTSGTGDGAEPS